MTPSFTPIADFAMTLGATPAIAETAKGWRRIVPITGAPMPAPWLAGRLQAVGVDDQLIRADALTTQDRHEAVARNDGAMLSLVSTGVPLRPPRELARIPRADLVGGDVAAHAPALRDLARLSVAVESRSSRGRGEVDGPVRMPGV